jgi:ubiquinone/menaquinone biosynthesis C-methylase UbiE
MHVKQQVTTYQELTYWYDNHYNQNGTWSTSQAYAQTLLNLLHQAGATDMENKTLLDVACGGAFFLEYSRPMLKYSIGCDISRVALAEAYHRCQNLQLCQANGEFLPYRDHCFDVVTCLGSLEHFLQPDAALAELRRVVRPEGWILILVPTNPDWATYDIQPTEVVMEAGEWENLFARSGLRTVLSIETDQDAMLKTSSGGCQVFCVQPM